MKNSNDAFQLMEAPDVSYVNDWTANWNDIVDFEVYPVISSKEAAERVFTSLKSISALPLRTLRLCGELICKNH